MGPRAHSIGRHYLIFQFYGQVSIWNHDRSIFISGRLCGGRQSIVAGYTDKDARNALAKELLDMAAGRPKGDREVVKKQQNKLKAWSEDSDEGKKKRMKQRAGQQPSSRPEPTSESAPPQASLSKSRPRPSEAETPGTREYFDDRLRRDYFNEDEGIKSLVDDLMHIGDGRPRGDPAVLAEQEKQLNALLALPEEEKTSYFELRRLDQELKGAGFDDDAARRLMVESLMSMRPKHRPSQIQAWSKSNAAGKQNLMSKALAGELKRGGSSSGGKGRAGELPWKDDQVDEYLKKSGYDDPEARKMLLKELKQDAGNAKTIINKWTKESTDEQKKERMKSRLTTARPQGQVASGQRGADVTRAESPNGNGNSPSTSSQTAPSSIPRAPAPPPSTSSGDRPPAERVRTESRNAPGQQPPPPPSPPPPVPLPPPPRPQAVPPPPSAPRPQPPPPEQRPPAEQRGSTDQRTARPPPPANVSPQPPPPPTIRPERSTQPPPHASRVSPARPAAVREEPSRPASPPVSPADTASSIASESPPPSPVNDPGPPPTPPPRQIPQRPQPQPQPRPPPQPQPQQPQPRPHPPPSPPSPPSPLPSSPSAPLSPPSTASTPLTASPPPPPPSRPAPPPSPPSPPPPQARPSRPAPSSHPSRPTTTAPPRPPSPPPPQPRPSRPAPASRPSRPMTTAPPRPAPPPSPPSPPSPPPPPPQTRPPQPPSVNHPRQPMASSTILFGDPSLTPPENHYLANWFIATFEDPILPNIVFNSVDQYVVYRKACLFNDPVQDRGLLARIANARTAEEARRIGRRIYGFVPGTSDAIWNARRDEIIERGMCAKFAHNVGLRSALMATRGATLAAVLRSPQGGYDKILGIGDPSVGDGRNAMGRQLMRVRDRPQGSMWPGEMVCFHKEDPALDSFDDGYKADGRHSFSNWRLGMEFSDRDLDGNHALKASLGLNYPQIIFGTSEHMMMFWKCLAYRQPDLARQVVHPRIRNKPGDAKNIATSAARRASQYDRVWWKISVDVVRRACWLKFYARPEQKNALLRTFPARLYESAPRDTIWGIGFSLKDALANEARWGKNQLGRCLEDVRAMFMNGTGPPPITWLADCGL